MTFAHPLYAVAAVLAALAFAAFARTSLARSRASALAYSDVAFLEAALGRGVPWAAIFVAAWSVAIALGGAALAGPSVVATVAVHDASIVLCIDTSGSMASSDVSPTRAGAARDAALTFIDGVPAGTRLGIVGFSSAALPLGPLSADRDAAREALGRLPPPNGGTAIGDALLAAARLLPPGGRRAIVLVTDGVNNAGSDPLAAASALGAHGISIFTVGIGTNGSGMTIPGTGEEAELDEDALRTIAGDAGGTYARAADASSLRERLVTLAGTTVSERTRMDLSLPAALAAGAIALAAACGGLLVGRFP
jgi:Ca-activated chloride channel family protein